MIAILITFVLISVLFWLCSCGFVVGRYWLARRLTVAIKKETKKPHRIQQSSNIRIGEAFHLSKVLVSIRPWRVGIGAWLEQCSGHHLVSKSSSKNEARRWRDQERHASLKTDIRSDECTCRPTATTSESLLKINTVSLHATYHF